MAYNLGDLQRLKLRLIMSFLLVDFWLLSVLVPLSFGGLLPQNFELLGLYCLGAV